MISIPQAVEGQIVVIQAADLMESRKLIPDLATWIQCFSIYTAVITTKEPERVKNLLAYTLLIAKCSLKYKWPSWVVYDLNFRQDAAEVGFERLVEGGAQHIHTVLHWCSNQPG